MEELESFLRRAIEGREYSKFVFTRNLSAALDALMEFAKENGIDRQQLSDIHLQDLLKCCFASSVVDMAGSFLRLSREGSERHRITRAVELPPLIRSTDDFYGFQRPKAQPNFVTRHQIVAKAAPLAKLAGASEDLRGSIVLIPQADPGFDWLFGMGIGGLITMYGGANSHMTIRAAELDLPAAIGVGEDAYQQLVGAKVIRLNCDARQLGVIQ